jgi:hypothetical protein
VLAYTPMTLLEELQARILAKSGSGVAFGPIAALSPADDSLRPKESSLSAPAPLTSPESFSTENTHAWAQGVSSQTS